MIILLKWHPHCALFYSGYRAYYFLFFNLASLKNEKIRLLTGEGPLTLKTKLWYGTIPFNNSKFVSR
jgi:hypothetical protein